LIIFFLNFYQDVIAPCKVDIYANDLVWIRDDA